MRSSGVGARLGVGWRRMSGREEGRKGGGEGVRIEDERWGGEVLDC